MSKPYPWYYAVNDRPVMIVELPGGGADCLVFDFVSGNLRPDRSYFAKVAPGSGGDVDQLTANTFEELLAMCRIDLVHRWCEKMCTLKGSAAELFELFGDGHKPPLPMESDKVEIKPDELAFSTVVLRFPPGVLRRRQIEQKFGAGAEQARAQEFFPHRFRYPVHVPGAKYICALYASTPHKEGGVDAPVITLAFNQEPNRSG